MMRNRNCAPLGGKSGTGESTDPVPDLMQEYIRTLGFADLFNTTEFHADRMLEALGRRTEDESLLGDTASEMVRVGKSFVEAKCRVQDFLLIMKELAEDRHLLAIRG